MPNPVPAAGEAMPKIENDNPWDKARTLMKELSAVLEECSDGLYAANIFPVGGGRFECFLKRLPSDDDPETAVDRVDRLAAELSDALSQWAGGTYQAMVQPSNLAGHSVFFRQDWALGHEDGGMTQVPNFTLHLNDVDDVLATAAQFGDVLFMAASDSAFDHDAQNATQSMCDAMREKIATARELLNEIRGRDYAAPAAETVDNLSVVSDASDLRKAVIEGADELERLMRRIHGGDWGVTINHTTQFVLVSRIYPSTENHQERAP